MSLSSWTIFLPFVKKTFTTFSGELHSSWIFFNLAKWSSNADRSSDGICERVISSFAFSIHCLVAFKFWSKAALVAKRLSRFSLTPLQCDFNSFISTCKTFCSDGLSLLKSFSPLMSKDASAESTESTASVACTTPSSRSGNCSNLSSSPANISTLLISSWHCNSSVAKSFRWLRISWSSWMRLVISCFTWASFSFDSDTRLPKPSFKAWQLASTAWLLFSIEIISASHAFKSLTSPSKLSSSDSTVWKPPTVVKFCSLVSTSSTTDCILAKSHSSAWICFNAPSRRPSRMRKSSCRLSHCDFTSSSWASTFSSSTSVISSRPFRMASSSLVFFSGSPLLTSAQTLNASCNSWTVEKAVIPKHLSLASEIHVFSSASTPANTTWLLSSSLPSLPGRRLFFLAFICNACQSSFSWSSLDSFSDLSGSLMSLASDSSIFAMSDSTSE